MSLTVPAHVFDHVKGPLSEKHRFGSSYDVTVQDHEMTDENLVAILDAAVAVKNASFKRVVEAIQRARSGDFDKSVPTLVAFPAIFAEFLKYHQIDGWLYKQRGDVVEAYLVTKIRYEEPRGQGDKPSVVISLVNTGTLDESRRGAKTGLSETSIHLYGQEVVKKKIDAILQHEGYLVETQALREAYDRQTAHHLEVLNTGFAEQFLLNGQPLSENDSEDGYWGYKTPSVRVNRKVINDTHPSSVTLVHDATSKVFVDKEGDELRMPVPISAKIRVFDLVTHNYLLVSTGTLTRYEYDSSLADKLVLPPSHRDLLDILTTDIATFTGDIIEGKSAGNVILCKGEPGVGKTLTAEVYSELIERPLYSIHSGALGVTAESIRKNLEAIFKRAKYWNAVLLLDEADVFVLTRGTNITQNAIVAEFLRTLEYFDGLMFMTTNRAADIDEAILSRTAAIISYTIPFRHLQPEIWKVLSTNFGVTLSDELIDDLVAGLPNAAPRDVKMLLRLALRVAKSEGVDLTVEHVQRASMFRGVSWDDGSYMQHLVDTGRDPWKEN